MTDFPPGFEQAESEFNRQYDPYADICPNCGAEGNFDECDNEYEDYYLTCKSCGKDIN